MRIGAVARGLLVAGVVVFVAGCSGGSDESTRTLEGGTYRKELGLTAIIDRVELGEDETRAYVTIRNPTAGKFTFEPFASTLTVDDQEHPIDRTEFPMLIPGVGAGGGETTGVLVFPAVSTAAGGYVLHIEGTSSNSVIGENGRVVWKVGLS